MRHYQTGNEVGGMRNEPPPYGGRGGASVPSSPVMTMSSSSPRSYDVSLLFCVRAVNLAWNDIVSIGNPLLEQMISQWLHLRICNMHNIPDEGANPRRACCTDVEMQPIREVSASTSISPHRGSIGGTAAAGRMSMTATTPLIPQVDTSAVDFTTIASDTVLLHPAGISPVTRTMLVDMSTVFTPPSGLRMRGGRGHAFTAGTTTVAATSPSPGVSGGRSDVSWLPQQKPLEATRHVSPSNNKGFRLILELLHVSLQLDARVFHAVLKGFLAVLPRAHTTHAELAIAIFENYPYICAPQPAGTVGGPAVGGCELLLQQSTNAAGNAMKSFLVLMNVMFNCASFDRQCEVLEMAKDWLAWITEEFREHQVSLNSCEKITPEQWAATQAFLEHALYEDDSLATALVNFETVQHALLTKDVHAVASTVHRYFERRLGADGTGKALLELLVHPATFTSTPIAPNHPIAFLFGVTPGHTVADRGSAGGAAAGTSEGSGLSHQQSDMHAAVSSAILTFSLFYLSMRSTTAAIQCADMAILNGHQSGLPDMLVVAHLLRAKANVARGNPLAAAEDAAIALQLATPTPVNASTQPWCPKAQAYLVLCELLTHYPGVIDPMLRASIMQNHASPLSSASGASAPRSGTALEHSVDVEVIHTLPQSIRHLIHGAQVALLEDNSGGAALQIVGRLMCDSQEIEASTFGLAVAPGPLDEHEIRCWLDLADEDRDIFLDAFRWCSPASVIVELGKRQAALAVHNMLDEFVWPAGGLQHESGTVMGSFRALLAAASQTNVTSVHRDGSSSRSDSADRDVVTGDVVLERMLGFSLALDLSATWVLWRTGYATLAHSRARLALEKLVPTGWLKPTTPLPTGTASPAEELCMPPEILQLVLVALEIVVETSLFFGSKTDAWSIIDKVMVLCSMCSFPRGVLWCKLMRSYVLSAEGTQTRATRSVMLLEIQREAVELGFLPLAAKTLFHRLATHITAGAWKDAKQLLTEEDTERKLLIPFVRRIPAQRVMWDMYVELTQEATSACYDVSGPLHRLVTCVASHGTNKDKDMDGNGRLPLPVMTRLSFAFTLLHSSRMSQLLSSDQSSALKAVMRDARNQLRSVRHVDSIRGIGDSLMSTCNTVLEGI